MRNGVKFGDASLTDTMLKDGLWDAFNDYHMGITAENVAKQFDITREQQDEFAALSQNRTEEAQKAHLFKPEITPVTIQSRKGICQGSVSARALASAVGVRASLVQGTISGQVPCSKMHYHYRVQPFVHHRLSSFCQAKDWGVAI